jgi:hypothetical protein
MVTPSVWLVKDIAPASWPNKTPSKLTIRDGKRTLLMFRTGILAPVIFSLISTAAFAQDARQFTCTGTMIEPSAMSQSPETVVLTLGPAQKVTLDVGKGMVDARRLSDNKSNQSSERKSSRVSTFTTPATSSSSTRPGIS